MARFKLTAKRDIFDEVKQGDMVYVDVPHPSWINTEIIRKALTEQIGRKLNSAWNENAWIIEKIN